ncbi:MAG: hypothetical protein KAR40_09530 [Candidatus Sabulitectum sp.]|nr:hypothetical protein [Candidatus Sabulitectum sp.]
MTKIELIACIVFVLVVLAGGIWWKGYKYTDCKKVGHSTLYCAVGIFTR